MAGPKLRNKKKHPAKSECLKRCLEEYLAQFKLGAVKSKEIYNYLVWLLFSCIHDSIWTVGCQKGRRCRCSFLVEMWQSFEASDSELRMHGHKHHARNDKLDILRPLERAWFAGRGRHWQHAHQYAWVVHRFWAEWSPWNFDRLGLWSERFATLWSLP